MFIQLRGASRRSKLFAACPCVSTVDVPGRDSVRNLINPDEVVNPFAFVTQLRPRLGTRGLDLPVRYLARNYFYKWLTVFDAHCSETGGGRQKTAEISFDCRP